MTSSSVPSSAGWLAGAAVTDLTPRGSVFLYGYPHVARDSTGVHDPLQCAALYLRSGSGEALFLANELIHVSRRFTADVRRAIATETGVSEDAIMITATHTHSGPVIVDHGSNAADAPGPKPDPAYLARSSAHRISRSACSTSWAR